MLLKKYYGEFFPNSKIASYIAENQSQLEVEVAQCMLLSNFYWAVYSLISLQTGDLVRPDQVHNYKYAAARVKMH